MMRSRSAKPDIELDAADEGSVMPVSFVDWNTLPEQVISSAEAAAEMQRAIAGLKPDLRVVFTLRDIEELSTHETAHVLGISESAVKVRLHRARLALREKLATYFEERVRV
jgi:RNA polymerase sigma-70 factor (ECF subfamily)